MRTTAFTLCVFLSMIASPQPASSQPRNSAPMQPESRPKTQPAQNQSAVQAQAVIADLRRAIIQARPVNQGPKIKNPRAANARNAMLGTLGKQKQAAVDERSQFIKAPKTRIQTSQNITVIPLPHTKTPAGGGNEKSNLPPPGPTPQNAKIDPGLCTHAQINTVNRQSSGVVFTPDPQYNLYTISGCGFGDQQGDVHIYGHFKSQNIKMNVEFWSNASIVAAVDPNVSGELDQDGVTLVVKPAGGAQTQMGGNRFYAARETVQLPALAPGDFAPNLASAALSSRVNGVGGVVHGVSQCGMPPDFSSPANAGGNWMAHVVRTGDQARPSSVCEDADLFTFNDLTPGFTTDSFQFAWTELTQSQCNAKGTALGGNPGRLSYTGQWDGQWSGDNIKILYRVQECDPTSVAAVSRIYSSVYWLNVWVTGPRGVNPRK